MMKKYGFDIAYLERCLDANMHNYTTTTYFLLIKNNKKSGVKKENLKKSSNKKQKADNKFVLDNLSDNSLMYPNDKNISDNGNNSRQLISKECYDQSYHPLDKTYNHQNDESKYYSQYNLIENSTADYDPHNMTEIHTLLHDDLINISGFDLVSKELLGQDEVLKEHPSDLSTLRNTLLKRVGEEQNSVISSVSELNQTIQEKQIHVNPSADINTFQSFSSKNGSLKKFLIKKNLAVQLVRRTPKSNTSFGNYNYKMKYDRKIKDKFTAIMCKPQHEKSFNKLNKGTIDTAKSREYQNKFLPYK